MRAQATDEEQPIHEDRQLNKDDVQEEQPEEQTRGALRDITDENYPTAESPAEQEAVKLMKKTRARKKGKNASGDQVQEPGDEEPVQVNISAEDKGNDVMSKHNEYGPQEESVHMKVTDQEELAVVRDQEMISKEAVEQRTSCLMPNSIQTPSRRTHVTTKTPKFDPEVHTELNTSLSSKTDTVEDSFVDSIKTRSPSKMTELLPEPELSHLAQHTISRTPARSPPRIEDSVEAIDALEDAMEQIVEELPTLRALEHSYSLQSVAAPTSVSNARRETALDTTLMTKTPSKAKTPISKIKSAAKPAPTRTTSGRVSAVMPVKKAPVVAKGTARPSTLGTRSTLDAKCGSPSVDASKRQSNMVPKRVDVTKLSTSKPAFVPAKSAKPVTTSTFALPGEAVAAKLKAQREERLKNEAQQGRKVSDPVSKAPTVKSTKPVTTSTFALPGEAVAAKLKAQREERAKKEETPEEQPKKVFKARPVPKASRPSVLPRENKASQARMSLMTTSSDKENVAPRESMTLSVPKPRVDANKANSSVRRTTSVKTVIAPRISSLTLGQKSTVTKEDAAQQKVRGKEVMGRVKAQVALAEKDRKDKEDAARKARADAAERGRQASREWAEKQKKKVALSTSTTAIVG